MKSNKFFMAILLSAVVLSGMNFHVYAGGWREYIPSYSSVAARLSGMTDWASRWATVFVSTLSEHKKKALLGALIAALGIKHYASIEQQKRMEVSTCDEMKKLVKEYNPNDDSLEMQRIYEKVKNFLIQQKKQYKSWFEIAHPCQGGSLSQTNIDQESLNFLIAIRDKFSNRVADKFFWVQHINDLKTTIKFLENKIANK